MPIRPTSLAVGPNGNLYVADPSRNQILERLPDGTFVTVAGTGQAGFSGDGGPALAAKLNDPGGMAFGSNGTLCFADQGNGRVRAISPSGTIKTVLGNGRPTKSQRGEVVTDGTAALAAAVTPNDVAFGPDRRLYVSTGQYVLRLDANRTVSVVAGTDTPSKSAGAVGGPASAASIGGPYGIAFDSQGNLYIFEFDDKTILLVTPSGELTQPFANQSIYSHGPAGLVTAPDGEVFAMGELSVVRLAPTGQQTTIATFYPGLFDGIRGFSPNGIAIGPDGTIYLDTYYGNGFADRSAIVSMSENGESSQVLWGAPTGQ
jgi:sugar lactone lactonase YvrE